MERARGGSRAEAAQALRMCGEREGETFVSEGSHTPWDPVEKLLLRQGEFFAEQTRKGVASFRLKFLFRSWRFPLVDHLLPCCKVYVHARLV